MTAETELQKNVCGADAQITLQTFERLLCANNSDEVMLSVLLRAVKEEEKDLALAAAEQELAYEEEQLLAETRAVSSSFLSFSQSIPKPQSFFATDREQKQTFDLVCRFMRKTDLHLERLRSLSLNYVRAEQRLIDCKSRLVRTDVLLYDAVQKAKSAQREALAVSVTALRTKLEEPQKTCTRYRRRLADLREKNLSVYRLIHSDFCEKILLLADFENQGKACAPHRVALLAYAVHTEAKALCNGTET